MGSEEAQVEAPKTASERLLQFHLAFCYRAYCICKVKNHDYGGASGETPWRNFESTEALGIASTESGILMRMGDKLNRLVTYVNDGKLNVPNEGAMDALLDTINYCVLLAAYISKGGSDE